MHHAESSKKRKRKSELQPLQKQWRKTNSVPTDTHQQTHTPTDTRQQTRAPTDMHQQTRTPTDMNQQTRTNRHAPAFGFTARLLFKITSAVQHPLYKGLHKTLLYTKRPDLQGFCETCIFFHIFPYTRKTFQNQGFSTHCIMYKRFSKPFIHIFSLPTTVNRH